METRGTRKNVWHADSKKSHGLGFSKSATKIQKSATKFSWGVCFCNQTATERRGMVAAKIFRQLKKNEWKRRYLPKKV